MEVTNEDDMTPALNLRVTDLTTTPAKLINERS